MITRNKNEIKDIIIFARLDLYNTGLRYGAKEIKNKLKSMNVKPLLSISKINRVLKDNDLTNNRTGYYPEDNN